MTPTQRAAAERLAFEQWYDAQPDGRIDPWDVWQAAALLRELLAVELVQEPVGWLNEIDGEFEHSHKPWMDNPTEEWHPVYAAPQQRKPPREQITAAAKALCRQASTACNVDFDDNWKLYGDEYIADATVALNAAYGITGEPT